MVYRSSSDFDFFIMERFSLALFNVMNEGKVKFRFDFDVDDGG